MQVYPVPTRVTTGELDSTRDARIPEPRRVSFRALEEIIH